MLGASCCELNGSPGISSSERVPNLEESARRKKKEIEKARSGGLHALCSCSNFIFAMCFIIYFSEVKVVYTRLTYLSYSKQVTPSK